jgi:sugar transferase (PEP-CTERM/EpsH1 system associated)
MEIVYVAHCVPWPPDKGDRIRAFHSVKHLAEHHDVHLACLARNALEASAWSDLKNCLASVRIETMDIPRAVARGFRGFARGTSFTRSFHASPPLQTHIRTLLATRPIGAVVLMSASMVSYAPSGVPFLADWGDVDSEKRFQYAKLRFPGFMQRLEGQRMRRDEREAGLRAARTFLTTQNELELFGTIAPGARSAISGNGIDTDFYYPHVAPPVPAELAGRRYLVFVGMLNYFPNSDGVQWFATRVFPKLRQRDPGLELLLVGRKPTRDVLRLGRLDGVSVVGAVDDVRPYLSGALAAVVPLRIARGIQNKVLEALAMGKRVLASAEVCRTFAPDLPAGILSCDTPEDYVDAAAALPATAEPDLIIAEAARRQFCWSQNIEPILDELAIIESGRHGTLLPRADAARGRSRLAAAQARERAAHASS